MLNRIKLFLDELAGAPPAEQKAHGADDLQLAAAALMVEAALMNDVFDVKERSKIRQLLMDRFELGHDEAEALIDLAEQRVADSNQLFGFTRVIKDHYSNDERISLLEMLWEVVYVDGELHDHEASLMRRVTGLLHVTDRDSGDARKRALQRLEQSGQA